MVARRHVSLSLSLFIYIYHVLPVATSIHFISIHSPPLRGENVHLQATLARARLAWPAVYVTGQGPDLGYMGTDSVTERSKAPNRNAAIPNSNTHTPPHMPIAIQLIAG